MGRRRVDMGAVVVSAVVGTILTLVNQGDLLFTGQLSLSLAWMIPLDYVMPLALVVSSSRLSNPEGETPSPARASSAHGDRKLGGR